MTSDYLANIDAFEHTPSLSKEAYEQNYVFGFTGGYLYAPFVGCTELSQDKEYFQANLAEERHHKWMDVLAAEGIIVVDRTMVTRLLTAAGGRVCGDTFDGPCMAYELGYPIVGMEFEDFHEICSAAPGDHHYGNTWDYVELSTPMTRTSP